MTLVSWLSTRFISSVSVFVRIAVQRFGLAPVVVASAAFAAVLLSWRYRPRRALPDDDDQDADAHHDDVDLNNDTAGLEGNNGDHQLNGQQRSNRTTSANNAGRRRRSRLDSNPNSTLRSSLRSGQSRGSFSTRKPRWLSRVKRVTIGAICSSSQPSNLFAIDNIVTTPSSSDDNDNDNGNNIDNDKSNILSQQTFTKKVTVLPDTVNALREFATLFDTYLVVRVDSDEMEIAVTKALVEAGVFAPSALDRRKLLFCESDTGRISVARQLESQLHIDESYDVIVGLQRFVQCMGFISPDAAAFPQDLFGQNVQLQMSLGGFFSS